MKRTIGEKLTKTFVALIVIVVIAGGAASAWPAYLRSCALKRRDTRLSAEIEEKKREIARLKEYQQRFKTDSEFVEAIARQNKRVFPGELVFIFECEAGR